MLICNCTLCYTNPEACQNCLNKSREINIQEYYKPFNKKDTEINITIIVKQNTQ